MNEEQNDKQSKMSFLDMDGKTTYDVSEEAQEALRRFQATQSNPQSSADTVIEGNLTLQIAFEEEAAPLLLKVSGEIVIGRRDPSAKHAPELDLTPYGGYQMGISRRHAILRIADKHLEIMDLGSRNGTYLNGKRLTAHQPVVINDGAEIRLGKIVMHLQFKISG